MLKECAWPFVVKHIHSFRSKLTYCIYMEFAEEGNLRDYVENRIKNKLGKDKILKESKILEIFVNLLLGLKKIHK